MSENPFSAPKKKTKAASAAQVATAENKPSENLSNDQEISKLEELNSHHNLSPDIGKPAEKSLFEEILTSEEEVIDVQSALVEEKVVDTYESEQAVDQASEPINQSEEAPVNASPFEDSPVEESISKQVPQFDEAAPAQKTPFEEALFEESDSESEEAPATDVEEPSAQMSLFEDTPVEESAPEQKTQLEDVAVTNPEEASAQMSPFEDAPVEQLSPSEKEAVTDIEEAPAQKSLFEDTPAEKSDSEQLSPFEDAVSADEEKAPAQMSPFEDAPVKKSDSEQMSPFEDAPAENSDLEQMSQPEVAETEAAPAQVSPFEDAPIEDQQAVKEENSTVEETDGSNLFEPASEQESTVEQPEKVLDQTEDASPVAEENSKEVVAFTETTEASSDESGEDEMLIVDENEVEPITVEVTDQSETATSSAVFAAPTVAVGAVAAAAMVAEESTETESVSQDLPTLTMDEHSCRACKHFSFSKTSCRGTVTSGECRRNAPTPGSTKAVWPTVAWDTWCGEYECGMTNEDMAHMAKAIGDHMEEENGMSF